jgi:C4-dicarboxylate transporter/malic acid transport protein
VTLQPNGARDLPTAEGTVPGSPDHPPLKPATAQTGSPLLSPGWFAAVMGTGIVASAAATLPHSFPGMQTAATVVWVVAALLLLVMTATYICQRGLRTHAGDPIQALFLPAPPVAMLTVGAGALLLSGRIIGTRAAVDVDWVLWSLGAGLGLVTTCAVPYLMITRHRYAPEAVSGGWLMPVVPPTVGAATGALLVSHAAAGQPRLAMLLGCYAMLGVGLLTGLIVLGLLYGRMIHHDAPTGVVVPTMWISLGVLGQGVTGLGTLATAAKSTLAESYAQGAAALALLGGVGVWGFAMLWLALGVALTVREFRTGLPFAPTWWAIIFPLGASVTGTSALAARTGSQVFVWPAVALYVVLVAAWAAVSWRSLRYAAVRVRGLGPQTGTADR